MNLQTLKNRKSERGFTIVELLIVIVVIAILAAISIVAYTGIQNRSRASASQSMASQLAKKADAYYAVQSSYPAADTDFGSVPESNLEGLSIVVLARGDSVPASGTGSGQTGFSNFTNGRVVYYQPRPATGTVTGYNIYYYTTDTTDTVATNVKRIRR